jgi:AraC-like DNA-binding protein
MGKLKYNTERHSSAGVCLRCWRKRYKGGLCRTHYHRRRLGDPNWMRPIVKRRGDITCCRRVYFDRSLLQPIASEASRRHQTVSAYVAWIIETYCRDYLRESPETDLGPDLDVTDPSLERSVVRAYEGGDLTVSEIAAEFSVSERRVYRILETTSGVQRRLDTH